MLKPNVSHRFVMDDNPIYEITVTDVKFDMYVYISNLIFDSAYRETI